MKLPPKSDEKQLFNILGLFEDLQKKKKKKKIL